MLAVVCVTASNSTEDEFAAAPFSAAKAAQCLGFILQELRFPWNGPTEIHTDNQAALQTINDDQAPTI